MRNTLPSNADIGNIVPVLSTLSSLLAERKPAGQWRTAKKEEWQLGGKRDALPA